jgi:DNA helicase TIP49 (TBP-interacting protein)
MALIRFEMKVEQVTLVVEDGKEMTEVTDRRVAEFLQEAFNGGDVLTIAIETNFGRVSVIPAKAFKSDEEHGV